MWNAGTKHGIVCKSYWTKFMPSFIDDAQRFEMHMNMLKTHLETQLFALRRLFSALFKQDFGHWDTVYNMLRDHFSSRWTATALDGPINRVQMLLNDADFQAWSKTFNYFAGLYDEQINTHKVCIHLKTHNLFDAFGIDQQRLAAHIFATVLWDPSPHSTSS